MNLEKMGEVITLKRKELNMTQDDLARKLNVTKEIIFLLETGEFIPDLSMIISLLDILDVSIDELLFGESINDNQEKTNNRKTKTRSLLICFREKYPN